MTYHEGELAVQNRAGVLKMAERIGRGIHSGMPPVAQNFLVEQTFVATSSVDATGAVWASLLTGEAGFLNPIDEETLYIDILPSPDDPLWANLAANSHFGLVAIDFASRSRVRVNGLATLEANGIRLNVEQAYSNCPKYIQARTSLPVSHLRQPSVSHSEQLTPSQTDFITRADTFFIASYHLDGGADASHRGGNPGFIYVANPNRLIFPDYSGNNMFNTLGNLTAYPRSGLVFPDFERGTIMHLTGRTEIHWDAEELAAFAGAERVIHFRVEQVIERVGVLPLHFQLHQYSPYNPR